jgi:uncharacterized protein YbbC (DUF1343 family)
MGARTAGLVAAVWLACACGGSAAARRDADARGVHRGGVRPGITVLLDDSIHLVRGKRVGLLTNQTGVDERGRSDVDLLTDDARAKAASLRLVALFSPEHGIRGTEDREQIASAVDERTGLTIHSLYTNTTVAPPDSVLRGLDALLFDLPDIGTRTWTYVGNLVYALHAARRNDVELIVLDRPAPLGGERRDGPMLDSALANPEEHTAARPGRAYALYPFPLRHGMTMGEMARFYNEELGIGARLHVVPMRGWRRAMWYDDTGLAWVRPSPNMPSLASALVYPALVPFEGTNLSVGRGTDAPFQRLGAPWMDARRTVALLAEREIPGVRFERERFTPRAPGDRKYDGRDVPGIRIVVTDRERLHTGRLGAALLWAISRTAGDSLRVDTASFDLRFGSSAGRRALRRGDDPDEVVDESLPQVVAFTQRARRYFIYR